MNLAEFTVKNYKSLREVKVALGNYTALIGENGSGKTSMLEALYLFFNEFDVVGGTPSSILQEATSWHARKLPLEFVAKIVLNEEEYRDIFPEDVLDKIIEKYGDGDKELTILRRISKPGDPWESVYIDLAGLSLVKDNTMVLPEGLTKSLTKGVAKRPTEKVKAFLFDPNADQSNLVGARLIVLNDTAYNMDEYTDSLVREGKIPFEHHPGEDHTAWAANQGFSLIENPPTREDVDALLDREVPLSGSEVLSHVQNKIAEKIKGKLRLIPATRNERVEPGERSSFLSEPEVIEPLRSLHGTDDEAWHRIRIAIERLIGQELDSVPKLSTWEDDLHLDVSLIGGGQQEIIGLIHRIHEATEPIIAIEEPETHLHHNLARNLSEVLKEAANTKQLIIATHSEYFAEISESAKNWFLEKKGREAKAKEIKIEKELVKAFGSLGAEPSDRGYPNKILFVAGETEEGVLPIWAKTLKANIKKVRIIPLEGEYDKNKIKTINNYIGDAQTTVFLMLDKHASEEVKQLLDEEHRLILEDTIEDCYPTATLIKVLNQNFSLTLTEDDIDPRKPRVEEIKRLLKEKVGIPKRRTSWKRWIGKDVAKLMSKDDIPQEVRDFIMEVGN